MPLYDYECLSCKDVVEIRRTMEERDSGVLCQNCAVPMQRILFHKDTPIIDATPKTLGTLGERNAAKFSTDYKHHIKMKNRDRHDNGKPIYRNTNE